MTYNQVLALVLAFLFVLFNNSVEGRQYVENGDGENEAKEGRSSHQARIISSLVTNLNNDSSTDNNIHVASWSIQRSSFPLHGTSARISVWGLPDVGVNSQSMVSIGVIDEDNDEGTGPHAVSAGFHVYPGLYAGNTDLRFFTQWNSGDAACYNNNCPGFVPSNSSGALIPGQKVEPLSSSDGKDCYITLSIKKDEKSQDWLLYREDDNKPILIGWWPKALFNNTFNSASWVLWGGAVIYPANVTGPPMGSGHAASDGANKAAYISHINLFDHNGNTTQPSKDMVTDITDDNGCYATDGFNSSDKDGVYFHYGGPAGCKN